MRRITMLFVLCWASSAVAFTNIDTARQAYTAVPFSEFYAEIENRNNMATAINRYWKDFNARVPRLSPSELIWITNELDTNDSVRIGRVTKTHEYHIWELGNLADQCVTAVDGLMRSFQTQDLKQTEMFHWSKVASCYHKSNSGIFHHLQEAGLHQNADQNDGFMFDHIILSRILNVIIPSAMADTMGWTFNRD